MIAVVSGRMVLIAVMIAVVCGKMVEIAVVWKDDCDCCCVW